MQLPDSTYREDAPAPALAPYVLCVWSQVIGAGAAPHPQRVLPDGCVDLVWIDEQPAVVAGPATRPTLVPLAPASVVIGVRLHPGAAAAVLGLPAHHLLNRATPLSDIRATGPDTIAQQNSIAARLSAAQALVQRLGDLAAPDRAIAAATCWLARHPTGRVEDLARRLDWSDRRLHRRFTAAVGYGPKTFQRVVRLQRVLALAGRSHGRAPLAGLAAAAGYADQAHMSRELRALAGSSPRALLPGASSTLELSDLFKTAAAPAL
jgi:AraC-like DNA-binding protein